MKKAYIAVAAALIILTAWLVISRIPAPEAIITFDGVRDTLVADLTCDASLSAVYTNILHQHPPKGQKTALFQQISWVIFPGKILQL